MAVGFASHVGNACEMVIKSPRQLAKGVVEIVAKRLPEGVSEFSKCLIVVGAVLTVATVAIETYELATVDKKLDDEKEQRKRSYEETKKLFDAIAQACSTLKT